ncbi:hypothetical protein GOBAR_AA14370 [Gossypium barbadense]|uniref:Uncharacterized protein n=1 Tax=Gossypium barbadense TaxID=3634 RepID=A0A2P5XSK7_GOSBA|nr:hypothetical protein GOBAR_AA14370 [Gossypium barbadense]
MNKRKMEELWIVKSGIIFGARAWQVGRVKLQQLGLGILRKGMMNSESLEHEWWARACRMTMLHSQCQPQFIVTRPCWFDRLTHGHVTWLWPLIASHVKEEFYPIFTRPCLLSWCGHGLRHAHEFTLLIPAINFINIRFKTSTVYLKSAKFRVNYLDCTIWENTEYRSLPSNIDSNPREQLNVIAIQDDEGLVAKPRPETVVSKGKGEVDHNEQKPLPNAMKFLKELLGNKQKLDEALHVKLNTEMSLKEVHEPFSNNSKGPIHEERRLRIKELDEWWTHKPRTHNKPKLRQNKLNTFPNQFKVGDKVLLDAADPHIVTTKPNEEIPLTILSIFPFVQSRYTMSSSRGKKAVVPASKKRKGALSSSGPTTEIHHPFM